MRRRRFGVVEAAVIDRKLSVATRSVHLDEALAELDISPQVILLSLHRCENDWIDANDRYDQDGAGRLERFGSCAKKRALFVDDVTQSECGGKQG